MDGKKQRLKKIFNLESQNTILLPMDHGMTMGPIKGIMNMDKTLKAIQPTSINAVLLQKGMINNCSMDLLNKTAVIMHLSASTQYNPYSGFKAIIGNVMEAVRSGCDGVSVHLNLGDASETEMLREIGKVSSDCYKYGMPLIAMVYARGAKIDDEHSADKVMHAARVGAEIGADIVKVNYTGDKESFKYVVDGCPIPVVIAGGDKSSEEILLRNIADAMSVGARGVSIGRNVFQSNNMEYLVQEIDNIINYKKPIIKEYEILNNLRQHQGQFQELCTNENSLSL